MAENLTQEKVAERVGECIGSHILSFEQEQEETIITLKVESIDKLLEICTILRDDEVLGFNFLSFVIGMDYLKYPSRPSHNCRFEVLYQFFSVEGGYHLRMKVPVLEQNGKLVLDSVVPIWRSAEFHEREVYDMFGISFSKHPDMRRLYMPEDWEGYPLRKDYDIRKGQDYGIKAVKDLVARHKKMEAK